MLSRCNDPSSFINSFNSRSLPTKRIYFSDSVYFYFIFGFFFIVYFYFYPLNISSNKRTDYFVFLSDCECVCGCTFNIYCFILCWMSVFVAHLILKSTNESLFKLQIAHVFDAKILVAILFNKRDRLKSNWKK